MVRALPRRQREAVTLHYLVDLPVAEVARLMGCREGTVKAHLTSAFSRIGATDRTQAALWAQRHGV